MKNGKDAQKNSNFYTEDNSIDIVVAANAFNDWIKQ